MQQKMDMKKDKSIMDYSLEELKPKIENWAKEKGIDNPDKQYLKIFEEVGETAGAILKQDTTKLKDGIGDIAVTVIIYYWQTNSKLNLEPEWETIDIKERIVFERLFENVKGTNPDIFDSLKLLSKNHNTTLGECLNLAWNEIKGRTGKTVGGTFIKD